MEKPDFSHTNAAIFRFWNFTPGKLQNKKMSGVTQDCQLSMLPGTSIYEGKERPASTSILVHRRRFCTNTQEGKSPKKHFFASVTSP